jgi:hypothetical protein
MTTRRDFVRRGALWALAAAVLPYEEIAERLNWTPKKLWAGHDFGRHRVWQRDQAASPLFWTIIGGDTTPRQVYLNNVAQPTRFIYDRRWSNGSYMIVSARSPGDYREMDLR